MEGHRVFVVATTLDETRHALDVARSLECLVRELAKRHPDIVFLPFSDDCQSVAGTQRETGTELMPRLEC